MYKIDCIDWHFISLLQSYRPSSKLRNRPSPCDLLGAGLAFHRLYHTPKKTFRKRSRKFQNFNKNIQQSFANYQNAVSSSNDKLTTIGLECEVVYTAARKDFQSELAQNQRKISKDISDLTTARPCLYRELYRPMLAALSFWPKENINFLHDGGEVWDWRRRQGGTRRFMGWLQFLWRENERSRRTKLLWI